VIILVKRVTIKDIASRAGVSVTTVAKAINDKARISEDTKRLIIDTAREMGYTPNKSARAMASSEINIGIVYPKKPSEFISYIEAGFSRGAEELADYRVQTLLMSYDNPNSTDQIKELLEKIALSNINGVIFFAGRNPVSYEIQMRCITEKHIPILFIVNEVENAGEIGTIRLNSEVAGAMAAQFLKLSVLDGCSVAVLVGNKDLKVHSRCIDGFMSMSKRQRLKVYGVYETNDEKDIAYYLTNKLFSECSDLGGLYVSSYNSVGVCQWLEDHGKQNDIKVIGQDLYPELVKKLNAGTLTATIFQNQFEFGRLSLHYIYEYLTGIRKKENCSRLLPPQIVMMSNVECFKHCY